MSNKSIASPDGFESELDGVLDDLYLTAWGQGRIAERHQTGIRSVTPNFREAKAQILQLHANSLKGARARARSRSKLLDRLQRTYTKVTKPIAESPMELTSGAELYNRFVDDLSKFIRIERHKIEATLSAESEAHP